MSIRLKQINKCEVCGIEFHPYFKEQRTCSLSCYNTIRSKHRRKRADYVCETCGNTYEAQTYRVSKYCSKECWSNRRKPILKICPNCKNEFDAEHKNKVYCSQICRVAHMVGEFSSSWKNGASLERERGRMGGDLAKWRDAVYKRDNYTCKMCGAKGAINAHHIKEFAKFPEFRLDIDNGITVCVPCHEKIHGKKMKTKYSRSCSVCGNSTTGRSPYCKSCGIKEAHRRAGHNVSTK